MAAICTVLDGRDYGLDLPVHTGPAKPVGVYHSYLAATLASIKHIRAMAKKKKTLRKGMVGEQILGKHLEDQLMPVKYQVLHDLILAIAQLKQYSAEYCKETRVA